VFVLKNLYRFIEEKKDNMPDSWKDREELMFLGTDSVVSFYEDDDMLPELPRLLLFFCSGVSGFLFSSMKISKEQRSFVRYNKLYKVLLKVQHR
jgi:hypothetical protein